MANFYFTAQFLIKFFYSPGFFLGLNILKCSNMFIFKFNHFFIFKFYVEMYFKNKKKSTKRKISIPGVKKVL